MHLIEHTTASQHNRRKPLSQIAEEFGITVNEQTPRQDFADEEYHCRVACVKPHLSIRAKIKCRNSANKLSDCSIPDFQKVIWTDKCAFNIGGFAGNTWITLLPGEEYLEDCLVVKLGKT